MRISDWSSDVCSSDLFRIFLEHELVMHRLVALGDIVSLRIGARLRMDSSALQDEYLGGTEMLVPWEHPALVRLDNHAVAARLGRSAERRVGKSCVSTCRFRWSPFH